MIFTQIEWQLRNYHPYNEFFIPLLLGLFLVITLRLIRSDYFSFLTKSVFNNSNVLLFARQDLKTGGLFTYVLIINYILSFSVAATVFIDVYFNYYLSWGEFFILSGGIFLFFLVKQLLLNLTSWITDKNDGIVESKYNLWIFFEFGGLFILLLSFILLFSQENYAFFSALIIVFQSLIYIAFLLRGIFIAIQHKISLFYIFLYLCTLEILPLVVIFYTFSGKINGLSGL